MNLNESTSSGLFFFWGWGSEFVGKVIGVCSGFNLNKKNAIFGEYAIAPRYRRFGIGNLLWKQCIEHCSNRNCAILATAKNVTKYREKSGFNVIPSRKLIQYVGYPQLFMLNKHHLECDFEWIDGDDFSRLYFSLIIFCILNLILNKRIDFELFFLFFLLFFFSTLRSSKSARCDRLR